MKDRLNRLIWPFLLTTVALSACETADDISYSQVELERILGSVFRLATEEDLYRTQTSVVVGDSDPHSSFFVTGRLPYDSSPDTMLRLINPVTGSNDGARDMAITTTSGDGVTVLRWTAYGGGPEPFSSGVEISSKHLMSGDEVLIVGYPGIFDKAAKIEELGVWDYDSVDPREDPVSIITGRVTEDTNSNYESILQLIDSTEAGRAIISSGALVFLIENDTLLLAGITLGSAGGDNVSVQSVVETRTIIPQP